PPPPPPIFFLHAYPPKQMCIRDSTYRDPVSGHVFGLGKDKEAAIREAVAANYSDQARPALLSLIHI
ncbi:phage integrase Arm DNA-binding domain-containing protein, partial [Pseudomonas sp. 5B4]